MDTKRVYSIEVQGADSVNDLKSAIEQLNDKLKELNSTSKEYKDTLEQLTELQGKLANAMQGISDAAVSTNESIDGIKESLSEMGDAIENVGGEVMESFVNGVIEGMTEAASSITVVQGSLEDLGQINSVKDLKQHISDLRDQLVTLENGSDEYKNVVKELIDSQVKLKEVMNAGKNEIEAAEGSYNALSQRMSALKAVWKETTDEATRNEIGQQINEINNQLKEMDASIGNNQRNVGNYKSALDGLDDSFIGWKQELKECKEALQQLDPSTQAYADTMARAAELTHNLSEQQEMIKLSSTDVGDQLNNIRGIAQNLAAGYSAVNAAMGLFGEENEEVQQAMLKVQQAMALVQGLQGLDGFMKKTKGLSQSLGLVTKATKANTVATKANAAAAKADAVAMGAETVATKAAVPAQLSLNAAMKANPIGFIIGLIASLVTIMLLLKDKIMEMIGANDEMSAAFDKVKAVLAGVGNVIKKSVINPIKLAIIPIKTLAKVMIDFFKGDWSAIGDDIKAGFEETKDTVVDTINVVGAFKEGYDKKTAEQDEAARKKRAEERSKELDDVIKNNEAKYKSDWKYTEDGKKAYLEYFKSLAEMYDKDSDEYKQALRDKEAYLNDFNEKQKESAEDMAAIELKLDVAKYGEQVKYSEKWYNYNKKLYDDMIAERQAFAAALVTPSAEQERRWKEIELGWETYLNERNNYYKKKNEEFKKSTDKFLADFKSKFDSLVNESDRALRSTLEAVSAFTATMKVGGKDYEALKMYMAEWEKLLRTIYTSEETIQLKLKKIRYDLTVGLFTNNWDNYIKTISKAVDKEFYNIDKTVQTFVNDIDTLFDEKKLYFGITFPEDEIKHIEKRYDALIENAENKAIRVRDEIDEIFPLIAGKLAEDLGLELSAITEAQVGNMIPEFQKLLDAEQNYCNEIVALQNDRFQKESDIWVRAWNNYIDIVKEGNADINNISNQNFQEMINNAIRWQGTYGNAIRDLYEDKDLMNEQYNEQKGQLERLRDMYLTMAEDERLTFEEKERAKREAAKITGDLIQLEFDKEVQRLKIQKGLWKEWANAAKDAASNVASILGTLSDYYTANMDLEQARIDQLLKDGKISEDEAERRYALQRKNFENAKKLQLAETWINGFSAAIGAYQSMASIPYVGPILGAAAAAATLALTAANAAKIKATSMENPYSSEGGSSSQSIQLPDVLELEPQLGRNLTGMSDTDNLNNDGSGNGRGETRVYVVESDISSALNKSNKRKTEVTF